MVYKYMDFFPYFLNDVIFNFIYCRRSDIHEWTNIHVECGYVIVVRVECWSSYSLLCM